MNTTLEVSNTIMQPPTDVEVFDSKTGVSWFDKDGILYSISKKVPALSMEETTKLTEEFKQMLKGKKVCMLVDVTNSSESNKEARDYAAQELPKVVRAVAMVSKSAVGKMLANIFFKIKEQPYPVKMFNTVEEARQWLKQYL
ncbi:MAG TPA: STAS/SEC14 domain-containing protein [Bacteroidia bacterium]|nr:STAS/SEC14 domain-containing protein [Bacteroidia bacterium]